MPPCQVLALTANLAGVECQRARMRAQVPPLRQAYDLCQS
jgi:hypothetical protein